METMMNTPTYRPDLPVARRSARHFAAASALALATALAATAGTTAARAQSFDSTSFVVSGNAIVTNAANVTNIAIDSEEVVIDWGPTNLSGTGPINFQPAGTTATFDLATSSNFNNYTVLNRILPTNPATGTPIDRAIQFNGTVQSFVRGVRGGTIWFYSPTGIIVGPGATFNTGNLVLTTDAIDTTGGLYGGGNTIRFRGNSGSTGFVTISPGATLNASLDSGSSYIALVASRVNQDGTLFVNGPGALVAAEQADITINAGLLDIVVTQGTTDSAGIVHTGTTGGPASGSAADTQILQMIAMPKNTALTMLLSGNIGYAPAALASNEASATVLSAGFAPYVPQATQDLGLGNITINNSVFNNQLTANATNTIDIAPTGGTVEFSGAASLIGRFALTAIAEIDETILFSGAPSLLASSRFLDGGAIRVETQGGTISAVAPLTVNAEANPDFTAPEPVTGGDAVAGSISLVADGGTIQAPALNLSAASFGENGTSSGGSATGGDIQVTVRNGGTISAANFTASTLGSGGPGDVQAGDGTGGSISLDDEGGNFDLGVVVLEAAAFGGVSAGNNGNANGGRIAIDLAASAHDWDSLFANATANGGQAFIDGSTAASGIADPDAIKVHIRGPGSLQVNGPVFLFADGLTGVNGAAGYSARGGGIDVLIDSGARFTITDTFVAFARALTDPESYVPGNITSPDAIGGTVSILADGGTIDLTDLDVSTLALGAGAANDAGTVTGGTSLVGAANAGLVRVAANATIGAVALGAPGLDPAHATGGSSTLFASDGTIDFRGTTLVQADAADSFYANAENGPGFDATGGTASVELRAGTSGTATMTFAELTVSADGLAQGPGTGATPLAGDGGTGTGGNAGISVAAGTLNLPAVLAHANGFGGISGSAAGPAGTLAFVSGDGVGGSASFAMTGGTASPASIDVTAAGFGGGGGTALASEPAAAAGNGTGGTATVDISGGTLTTGNVFADATGIGGNGMAPFAVLGGAGGDGGNGSGGTARIIAVPGGNGQATISALTLESAGIGGDGATGVGGADGNAGIGTGGSSVANLQSGRFAFGDTLLAASGRGGVGAVPGNGIGGTANFALDDPASGAAAPRTIASLTLQANGDRGGTVNTGTAGSTGLTATTGGAGAALAILGNFTAEARGGSALAGNGFTASIGGAPFTVGGNSAITTSRNVTLATGAAGSFDTAGSLTIVSRGTVTGTGPVSSGGNTSITAPLGIAMTDLASGGTTNLLAVSGPVNITHNLTSAGLVTALGRSIAIHSLGSLAFADLDATAGDLLVETTGDLDAATVDASGAVALTSTGGRVRTTGAVNGAGIAIAAAGNVDTDAGLASTAALAVTAGGAFTSGAPVTATGNVALDAAGGITVPTVTSGGSTLLRATGGAVTVATDLTSPGAVTAVGRAVNITSTGALTFDTAQATGGDFTVNAAGDLTLAGASASGALALASNTGGLTASGPLDGSTIALDAQGPIAISGANSTGTFQATTADTFDSSGTITTFGNANIVAALGINADRLISGANMLLRSTDGTVFVANLNAAGTVDARGQSIDIASSGSLSFSRANASSATGSIRIRTIGNLDLVQSDSDGGLFLTSTAGAIHTTGRIDANGIVLDAQGNVQVDGDAFSTGNFGVRSRGTFGLSAIASGTNIDIESSNISLAPGARLGTRSTTQTIVVTNTGGGLTVLGGDGSGGGFNLDQGEADRLFADQRITLEAPADMIVGDLAMDFGAAGNIGTGGTLKLDAPGLVEVNGTVELTTSSADDTFSIDPREIFVNGDGGSITMRNGAGALGGTLDLVAQTIMITTAATKAAVDAVEPIDQVSDILDVPSAVPSDGGTIQAANIRAEIASGIFMENTGTSDAFADRRGFTANTFAITTTNPGDQIAINGMILDAAGQPVTGLDTEPLITINGVAAAAGGRFDPLSTINGCVIGAQCGTSTTPPTRDDLDGNLTPPEFYLPQLTLIEVEESSDNKFRPLIDEPVTGVGNDDLWQANCEPGTVECSSE